MSTEPTSPSTSILPDGPGAEVAMDADPTPTTEEVAGDDAGPATRPSGAWRRRLRWIFVRRLCFGGLAGAAVFFCLSMAPSLVPRSALMQGVVSGVAAAIGYGLGSAASAGIRRVIESEPSPSFKRRAWIVLAVGTVVLGALATAWGIRWQQRLRSSFEMEQLGAAGWPTIIVLTVVVFALLVLIARLVRGVTRGLIGLLEHVFPSRGSVTAGLVLVGIGLVAVGQGLLQNVVVSGVGGVYSVSDQGTSPWISQPTSELRSGGPESLIEWDTLGKKGRDFTGMGGGPTVEEIEAFTGEPASEPIRVYVGLRSADDVRDRVDLAMAELERTGAFDRAYVVVNTTTGTGWVDENVVDSFEFMHGGDTAQVAMQYSYLPSWVSFLVDRAVAEEAGERMITAVTDRIESMPLEERPMLYVFGESLGSYGTEAAFTSPENMLSNIDGGLLVGPTFVNPLHGELTAERDEGSPAWLPIVDGGVSFRFAVEPDDLDDPELYADPDARDGPRVVYLQNASDPITYFDPELILNRPEWLDDPRGPDVRNEMVYLPFISFFQIAADMAFAMDVPDGHGHRYGANVVDGWAEVSAPDGWTDEDTERLRDLTEERAELRNARKAAE